MHRVVFLRNTTLFCFTGNIVEKEMSVKQLEGRVLHGEWKKKTAKIISICINDSNGKYSFCWLWKFKRVIWKVRNYQGGGPVFRKWFNCFS